MCFLLANQHNHKVNLVTRRINWEEERRENWNHLFLLQKPTVDMQRTEIVFSQQGVLSLCCSDSSVQNESSVDYLPSMMTAIHSIFLTLNRGDYIFGKVEEDPYYFAYIYTTLIISLELILGRLIPSSHLNFWETICKQSSELTGHGVDPTW